MERLQRMLAAGAMGGGAASGPASDTPQVRAAACASVAFSSMQHTGLKHAWPCMRCAQVDTAEQIYISSLALLKMLKHGKAAPWLTRDPDLRPTRQLAPVPQFSQPCFHICSLHLILPTSMLAAGRAGVPMEVMGLMLGEFIDDYTVRVVDVFAMPQSGTGVSVEAVDPVFQTKMLDMLKQVGRCVGQVFCTSSASVGVLQQICQGV